MKILWLVPVLALMAWFIWKFISGLTSVEPNRADMKARRFEDGDSIGYYNVG